MAQTFIFHTILFFIVWEWIYLNINQVFFCIQLIIYLILYAYSGGNCKHLFIDLDIYLWAKRVGQLELKLSHRNYLCLQT
jgi:hypothetical protein